MGGMIAHTKRGLTHERHALGGPHLTTEAVVFGPLREQPSQFRPLLRGEPRRGPRRRMPVQRVHASLASALEPLPHGTLGHP
jgi:hypothetical protein